ncbi:MAG TPA: hypothetical protein VGB13_12235 [Candidatus Krumholzibacteria bacterium]|jgi:hypothetical protein
MRFLPSLCVLVAVLSLSHCSDRGACLEIADGYATTPDETVVRYRRAYTAESVDDLGKLLASSFQFALQAVDAESLGISPLWNRDEELAIAGRIFADLEGVRVDSTCQPPPDPIVGLQLNFDQAPMGVPTSWEPVTDGPYAGSLRREYGVNGQLLDANGLLDFMRGIQAVYVRADYPIEEGSQCQTIWRIVGWEDLGVNSTPFKHGIFSWGRVKARWRSNAPIPTDCN